MRPTLTNDSQRLNRRSFRLSPLSVQVGKVSCEKVDIFVDGVLQERPKSKFA
jgi:hypothetical protein